MALLRTPLSVKHGRVPQARPKKRPAKATEQGQMTAPASGVKVRMYRQGHGDCFLLAFRGTGGRPFYVLIDCGCKPGSDGPCYHLETLGDAAKDIKEATAGCLDRVVITHEHQDHVNGFWKKDAPPFAGFKIGEAWFAWTEDPDDPLANELRRRHHDQLLGLIGARNKLAADSSDVQLLDDLLSLELGLDLERGRGRTFQFQTAAADLKNNKLKNSVNKQGMKLIKDLATAKNVKYIKPHKEIMKLPTGDSAEDHVRVFAFGPPYDANLIADEDPKGSEAFPDDSARTSSFFFALQDDGTSETDKKRLSPFARRFTIPLKTIFSDESYGAFFTYWYGEGGKANKKVKRTAATVCGDQVPEAAKHKGWQQALPGAKWRRIDNDWLNSADQLALALNTGVNNTSLVLAFELPKSKKVLLFVGDAQRGSWKSWTKGSWKVKGEREKITVRDLMSRTVLYKVGHHGSHNATLKGTSDDPYPNLSWMGHGNYGREFTAMITAVSKWAHEKQKPPWNHPLKSIRDALLEKAGGRVFQTDTDVTVTEPPWKDRDVTANELYFEYVVADD